MGNHDTDPHELLKEITENISELLTFEKEEGRRSIDVPSATVAELSTLDIPAAEKPMTPRPAKDSASATTPSPAAPEVPVNTEQFRKMETLAATIKACTNCPLCESRTNTVPGQGATNPDILFIGEGPGADEDAQGLAFVGRSGQLLTRLIAAMEISREEVWIGNIVKCRPPDNRTPYPDEMAACIPYLKEQLAILKPKVIVCLGATAVKGLLDTKIGITKLRGTWMSFEGIDVMPTYHPSYLLRGGGEGKARYWEVWEDMKTVLERLGRKIPDKKKT